MLIPAQKQLSASSYTEVEQANTRLGTIRYRVLIYATVLSQLCLLLFVHDISTKLFQLTFLSLLLVVGATIMTVFLVVPINRHVHTWSIQAPPATWKETRNLWHRYHYLRTALVLLAMILQFLAVLLPR